MGYVESAEDEVEDGIGRRYMVTKVNAVSEYVLWLGRKTLCKIAVICALRIGAGGLV